MVIILKKNEKNKDETYWYIASNEPDMDRNTIPVDVNVNNNKEIIENLMEQTIERMLKDPKEKNFLKLYEQAINEQSHNHPFTKDFIEGLKVGIYVALNTIKQSGCHVPDQLKSALGLVLGYLDYIKKHYVAE